MTIDRLMKYCRNWLMIVIAVMAVHLPAKAAVTIQTPGTSATKGLIWQYSKGSDSGYLLGSVHFADSSFYPLSPAIMSAYNRSKKLVVEVDESRVSPETQQQLLLKHGFYPDGGTLFNHLSARTLKVVSEQLKAFGLSLEQVKHYRPGMLAIQLTALQAGRLGYSPEQGIDRYFMQKARHRKPIEQIETFQAQMELIAQLPVDDAVLHDNFANMKGYEDQWKATMSAWKLGDGDALYDATIGSALRDFPSLAPFFDVLFFDRHPRMLEVAERCVGQREQCFIVVGAGHLVGPNGLLELLEKKGYALTQL